MTDTVPTWKRSQIMSRVQSKNTRPEMAIRRLVHGMGYRYRLHEKKLPGKPDLVFASRHKVIFVHGCFWHRHEDCLFSSSPKSNQDFWNEKFKRNIIRDQENYVKLRKEDWSVLVIWQCELRDLDAVKLQVTRFLGPPGGRLHT